MKFSLRDLLLVTVIVALAVGWGVDRGQLASESQRLQGELTLKRLQDSGLFGFSGVTRIGSEVELAPGTVLRISQSLVQEVRGVRFGLDTVARDESVSSAMMPHSLPPAPKLPKE